VKRGAKKDVVTPLDAPQAFAEEAQQERQTGASVEHTALVRALGLAHHWQRLLDGKRATSAAQIAEAEGVDVSGAAAAPADPVGPGGR
jgi:hypothetical protein